MTLVIVIGLLAVGTFALRLGGAVLRGRVTLPGWARRLLPLSAIALLAALAATAACTDGGSFVGVARPAGVLVGAVLAWRRAPFIAVVVAAAVVAAGLRLLGVP
ncbi:AzlD domain-containing protein [Luedemannella flava]|uniref:AzlD domain-containing protein n=1 Tax=Luedemannella flava TaxID=349316 RepID=A0ABP4YZA1_9ACTN